MPTLAAMNIEAVASNLIAMASNFAFLKNGTGRCVYILCDLKFGVRAVGS